MSGIEDRIPNLVALLIADAVTSREDLLHVLGAGLTQFRREEYPAALQAYGVAAIQVESTMASGVFRLRFEDRDSGADVIDPLEIPVVVEEVFPGLQPGQSMMLHFMIDMTHAQLPGPGAFRLAAYWDSTFIGEFRFQARLAD